MLLTSASVDAREFGIDGGAAGRSAECVGLSELLSGLQEQLASDVLQQHQEGAFLTQENDMLSLLPTPNEDSPTLFSSILHITNVSFHAPMVGVMSLIWRV